MSGTMNTIALCTAIYPGVEAYLKDWYRSVLGQTDHAYRLWIGLDAISQEDAKLAMGGDLDAEWIEADPGDTPAQVRQRVLERVVETCDGVVLVDSDDVLHPSRVASARAALRTSDLSGSALRVVDQQCRDLGLTFGLPAGLKPEDVFPGNNVYGLSNSAYRSELLRECLPVPPEEELVDWFLATRAWLMGAGMSFDPVARMYYRQHETNTARVKPPFGTKQVAQDTERVMRHFQVMQAFPLASARGDRAVTLERTARDIETFHRLIVLQPARLEKYVQALNALEIAPIWWSCVANHSLKHMWTT